MQDASVNFVLAATGAGRTWMPIRLRTDWNGDGYDGDGTFDDLSRQAGGWSVSHHLDDGLPEEVSFVSGLGTAEMDADLAGAPSVDGVPLPAAAYFSPLRTESPIFGYDRDIAPVTADVGLVTDSGPEYVRVFTGQMIDTPLKGGRVALSAISTNRLKLAAFVHPPAVAGRYEGARADWVISYALASCGVYLSPPPQPGCRWWAPMHGSIHPFIPSDNPDSVGEIFFVGSGTDSATVVGGDNQTFRPGPFHLAAGFQYEDADNGGINYMAANGVKRMPFADGDDMASQAGLRGKIEMWVYGYPTDFNDAPTASGGVDVWVKFRQANSNGSLLDMGIGAAVGSSDRKPYIGANDGTTGSTFAHSTQVPKDDQWHFVGIAYDFSTPGVGKRWINLDGVVETDNTVFAASGFPAFEDYSAGHPYFLARWPVAEVQITAGEYANPDDHPWLLDIPFTATARMTPSTLNLVNIAETESREAWELIGSHAQAELASLRTDELDIVNYLGPGWWVKDEQQIVRDAVTTDTNSMAIDAVQDPTKIRNAVRVSYDEALSSTRYVIVGTLDTDQIIPPGLTAFTLPLTTSTVEVRGFDIAVSDGTGTQPMNTHYITLNTVDDGTGTYMTSAQATVTITEWHPGAVTIEIDNRTGANLYIANDVNWPSLAIAGKPHHTVSTFVQDDDPTSIAARGQRSLAVSVTAVQRAVDARRLARNLKANLRKPVIVIGSGSGGITVAGDPRRQPGDLTRVRDTVTGIDDTLWRSQTVEHVGKGAMHRNTLTFRRTLPILVIGVGRIGETVIGPTQD